MKLAELAGLFDMSMRREALQQFFFIWIIILIIYLECPLEYPS